MNQKNISIYFSNDLKIRCAYPTLTNFFFLMCLVIRQIVFLITFIIVLYFTSIKMQIKNKTDYKTTVYYWVYLHQIKYKIPKITI